MLRIEDISPIENDLQKKCLYLINRGIRVVQPTYNYRNSIGSGCMDSTNKGLTEKGKRFVKILNEYKIMIDLSHTSEKTSQDIIKISDFPPLCTHSFCKSLFDTPRGKSDKFLKLLGEKNGFFGVTINPSLISENSRKLISIEEFFAHIQHAVSLIGEKNVGIGTDFDVELPKTIGRVFNQNNFRWDKKVKEFKGMQDWAKILNLMKNYGFNQKLIKGICGNNFLQFYKQHYK